MDEHAFMLENTKGTNNETRESLSWTSGNLLGSITTVWSHLLNCVCKVWWYDCLQLQVNDLNEWFFFFLKLFLIILPPFSVPEITSKIDQELRSRRISQWTFWLEILQHYFFSFGCSKGGTECCAPVVSLFLRITSRSHWYHSSAYSCFHRFLSGWTPSKCCLCFCQDVSHFPEPHLLKKF